MAINLNLWPGVVPFVEVILTESFLASAAFWVYQAE